MKWYKDGKEYTDREIKKANLNISYKSPGQLDYTPVLPTPKPSVEWNERVRRDGVTTDSQGNTVEKWKVVPKFTEYINDDDETITVEEQEAAYKAKLQTAKFKEVERAVQGYINTEVKERGYDNENSIAKYLVDGNEFYAECKAISLWIGSIWAYLNQIPVDVLAGDRTMPTEAELLEELPVLEV